MNSLFIVLILILIILNLDNLNKKVKNLPPNFNFDWFCRNTLGINTICNVENFSNQNHNSNQNSNKIIPKIIHHTWKDKNKIPEEWKKSYNSWRKYYPEGEYKYMFWTDEDNLNLIKNHFPEYLEIYKNYPKTIQRVDAVRYFILYKYGGIYADMDYEVKKNFFDELEKEKINIIESPYIFNETLQNSLIASPPGHSFWLKVFEEIKSRRNIRSVLNSTGPKMLSDVYNEYSKKNEIKPLSCYNYQRVRWHDRHIKMKKNGVIFKECGDENNENGLYGIHHNSSSWN